MSGGNVDTVVRLYRRVSGPPSLAITDMADFFLVASNDDQLSNQCPAAGSPSPMDSFLDTLPLVANTQYIIAVVCIGKRLRRKRTRATYSLLALATD